MLPGPIFNIELLTSARRARHFLVRAAYATVLLGALWMVYSSTMTIHHRFLSGTETNIQAIARFSAAFFSTFSTLQLLAVVAIGPALVAGAIATERERRTIEYLFASPLGNAEIVLGKLAARLLHVLYLVLAGLPVLALVMLLGGIAPESLVALAIITLSTAAFVGALSISVSVWSLRAKEAVTRTYVLLFALLLIPPMLFALLLQQSWLQPYTGYVAPVNMQLVVANPFWAMQRALLATGGAAQQAAGDALGAMVRNQLIGAFALALAATLGVRRAHLRQRGKSPRRRWRLMHLLRPAVGNRPMLWKELFAEPAASRLGVAGRIALVILILGIVAPTFFMFFSSLSHHAPSYRIRAEDYIGFALMIGTLLSCGGLALIASRAAGSIASERERDCWASLVSTPLEPGEIVWAKILGAMWSMRGLLLMLALLWGLGAWLDPGFLIAIPFLLGTLLILTMYAAALGAMFSLRCRSSVRAMAATLAVGLFAGGGYLCCCMPPMMFGKSGDAGMAIIAAPCVPFLLAIPGIIYSIGDEFFRNSKGGFVLMAYIGGLVGYLVASLVLVSYSVGTFDARADRTRLPAPGPRPLVKCEPADEDGSRP